MKNIKKGIFSILLSMIIALSLSTNVFAVTQVYPTDYTYIELY